MTRRRGKACTSRPTLCHAVTHGQTENSRNANKRLFNLIRVWLFAMVLGYSRLIWARYVVHQDLATVLCCDDRMKTAVPAKANAMASRSAASWARR